mgnify:CR=1 FL=1
MKKGFTLVELSIVLVIIGLLFLVLIHEAGHFVAARMVGIRATKFFVGFPPKKICVKKAMTNFYNHSLLIFANR